MLGIMSLPVVAVLTLASLPLYNSVITWHQMSLVMSATNHFLQIDDLVNALQLERGWSTFSMIQNTSSVAADLEEARQATDKTIGAVTSWNNAARGADPLTGGYMRNLLANLRARVSSARMDFRDILREYTSLNDLLMMQATDLKVMRLREGEDIWQLAVAASMSLQASDALGIQRAIGAVLLATCPTGEHAEDVTWFSELTGQYTSYQKQAFAFYPAAEGVMETGVLILDDLEDQKLQILYSVMTDNCSETVLYMDRSMTWWNIVSDFMDLWRDVRREITSTFKVRLEVIAQSQEHQLAVYATVMAAVVIVTACLGWWYTSIINNITFRMSSFAEQMAKKSVQVISVGLFCS